ncbi:hypothetical protein GCM10023169_32060 [Georgenia halophila]|uniref:Uncharacterized protein n=1 Tax=Georgenia halophila TaxID=620889 RepID=A0ABP8LII7_9MICO
MSDLCRLVRRVCSPAVSSGLGASGLATGVGVPRPGPSIVTRQDLFVRMYTLMSAAETKK